MRLKHNSGAFLNAAEGSMVRSLFVVLACLSIEQRAAVTRLPRTSPVAALLSDEPNKCPPLGPYANAEPKNYADSRKTQYVGGKHVAVEFVAGDKIPFECEKGYTTDGSKDGSREFDVECSELGYYKTMGVCIKASKCGAAPEISHARPTGKKVKEDLEFTCSEGYSLDGESVVAGGLGKNQLFVVDCVEFSGDYKQFEGECKPYAYVSAKETNRMYNQVFEALFIVSCKGKLKERFGEGKSPGVGGACDKIDDGDLSGDCQGLVTEIRADFEKQQAAREAHDAESEKEWFEEKDPERPGIHDEAKDFCVKLWGLLAKTP
jgi:hypothetical protein